MDLASIPTEELMKMRDAPSASGLADISTEELMRMRGVDEHDPTGSFGENMLAGAGKAIMDVGRGAGQMARGGLESGITGMLGGRKVADFLGLPTQADLDESKRIDAPLMKTGGGTVGNIAGSAALFAPSVLMPGANTVTGAALAGSVMGALQPTATGESRALNTAIGGVTGGVTQKVLGKASDMLTKRAATKAADAAQDQAGNAVRDAVLKTSREAGYVVPPAQVNPTLGAKLAESAGGKVATEQAASVTNQKVTDKLAREAIGMKGDAILSKASLADARNAAAAPYREVADLSPNAKTLLEDWKKANFDAKMQWNYFRKSGNPEAYEKATAAGELSEKALTAIEQEATALNVPHLFQALKDARVKLAKLHTVESAMSSGGHIDARMMAKIAGRQKLDGPLLKIAEFGENFPKASGVPGKTGSAEITTLRSTIGTGIGAALGGFPGAAVGAAAGVAVPWTVRRMLLSGAGQRVMGSPSYATAPMARTVGNLLSTRAARGALPAGAVGAVLDDRFQEQALQ